MKKLHWLLPIAVLSLSSGLADTTMITSASSSTTISTAGTANQFLILTNQTMLGLSKAGLVLVAEVNGGRKGAGLTQIANRFNITIPSYFKTKAGKSGVVLPKMLPCRAIDGALDGFAAGFLSHILVLDTKDSSKSQEAKVAGRLVLASSSAVAKISGGEVPPTQGSYLFYVYSGSKSSSQGQCSSENVGGSNIAWRFSCRSSANSAGCELEQTQEPLLPTRTSYELKFEPGWNLLELAFGKNGDTLNAVWRNAATTKGFQWYFVR
jgi:hypothetical protein